jgi:lycopene cyclase domain-containing protein
VASNEEIAVTYFGVLGTFVVPPTLILLALVPRDVLRWLVKRKGSVNWEPYLIVLAHVLVALVYTTPWDNYLIANGVWWYAPELVTGMALGWVPIEEYTFFIVQTLLTGLWTLALIRFVFKSSPSVIPSGAFRSGVTLAVAGLWMTSTLLLLLGPASGTYLTLILSWALIPILIQVAFGADILFAHRRLLAAAIFPLTLYLWLVDAIAIQGGTWSIDPARTTGIKLGPLPLEEMLFFLMTNLIIVFGVTLMLSEKGKGGARTMAARLKEITHATHKLNWKPQDRATTLWTASLVLWVALLIATPISMWLAGDDLFPFMASLGVLAQGAATLIALSSGWPATRALGAVAVVFGGAWAVEALGSTTGIPFGVYGYTDTLRPQLAGVPLLIPLAWFMMLVPAWAVAEAMLAGQQARLRRWYAPLHAALAGAAFTAWDLVLDPQMVARGLWTWDQPGGYFGIPWVNFLGWWLAATLLTFFVCPSQLPRRRLLVIYTVTWAFQTIGLGVFWGQPGPALAGLVGIGAFVIWAWRKELLNLPIYRSSNLPMNESKPWTSSSGP